MLHKRFVCCATVVLALIVSSARAETPYQNVWTQQLGTSAEDFSYSVTLDADGNAYVGGNTTGSLGGSNQGHYDAFLSKYDSSGSMVWTQQLGSDKADYGYSVAVDPVGNVYIGGRTSGSTITGCAIAPTGGPPPTTDDAYLAKYDSSGALQWTRQLGMSSSDEYANSVAVDASGNVFIGGVTNGSLDGTNQGGDDAFVAKYDSSGSLQWTRQWGTSATDYAESLAVDSSGNVIFGGATNALLGGLNQGYDALMAKYDSSGSLLWTEQLGTFDSDYGHSVDVDSAGNVLLCGKTSGSLGGSNQGSFDAFLAKYDPSGTQLWSEQLGTGSYEFCYSVSADADDNMFIVGHTLGSLGGANEGNFDAYLAKYDASGTLLWTQQLGSDSKDDAHSVDVDSAGNVFFCGVTQGLLGETQYGGNDAYLAKYAVPEPGSLAMLAGLAVLGLIVRAWRKRK